MKIKAIIDEDFSNYKKVSMVIATHLCDYKCCKDGGFDISVCQNSPIATSPTIDVDSTVICHRYLSNSITQSIVFGGLEPMLQFGELVEFIDTLRNEFNCNDDIVIYTGYYKDEIPHKIEILKLYPNIIIKFGRYNPNLDKKYDPILGVTLASHNQYAERIS